MSWWCVCGSRGGPDWGATGREPMSLALSMSSTPRRRMAYERLLVDALKGEQTLFVRDDEVEAAWRWIDSVSAAWSEASTPVQDYPAGSWGPAAASGFLPVTLAINRSEEHTSEVQSLLRISYAVRCLKKKQEIVQKQ